MFEKVTIKMKRKQWWRNAKLWIILSLIILMILAVIISKRAAVITWLGSDLGIIF